MGVQLRIAGARRPVTEGGCDETVSRLNANPAMAPADRGRRALEVSDGFLDRPIVGSSNLGPQLAAAQTTLTRFDAENVRSNPATRTALDLARNGNPPRGSSPASTRRSAPPATSPERPSCAAPTPTHLPRASAPPA
jgi:hypothetical protein